MEWNTKTISLQPFKESEARIEIQWMTFKGQHWRKPISILCKEDIVLPPFTQTVVPIKSITKDEQEGLTGKMAIITPSRDKQILMKNFSTAYGCIERVEELKNVRGRILQQNQLS